MSRETDVADPMAYRGFWFEPAWMPPEDRPTEGETRTSSPKGPYLVASRSPMRAYVHSLPGVEDTTPRHLQRGLPFVCWAVELTGKQAEHEGTIYATSRRHVARFSAAHLIFECSCRFALSVAHLWEAPDVVKRFLMTGDHDLRSAASAATRESIKRLQKAGTRSAKAAADAAKWAIDDSQFRESLAAIGWSAADAFCELSLEQKESGRDRRSSAAWALGQKARAAAEAEQAALFDALLLRRMAVKFLANANNEV